MDLFDKVKIIWQVRKILKQIKEARKMKETKTELYVSLASEIMILISFLLKLVPPEVAVKATVIIAGIYAFCRSAVKIAKIIAEITTTKKDDEIIQILEEILEKVQPPSLKK